MKLTKETLKQIIKEELEATLGEARNIFPTAGWAQKQLSAIEDEGMRPSAKLKRHLAKIPPRLDMRDTSEMEVWFNTYKELRGGIEGFGTVEGYTFQDFANEVKMNSGFDVAI